MSKLKNILLFCIFFTLTLPGVFGQVKQSEMSSAERKVKLSWKEVDGAVSYKVVIKDSIGNTIIDKESDSNNFTLELQPDNYKIRIGSFNKFGKLGSWSDWADLIIERPVVKPVEKEKDMSKSEVPLNFKIGMGGSYFVIQPDWNKYYKDSYNAFSMDIAYGFRSVDFPFLLGFMKYTGLDIESNYVKFTGKAAFNKIESDITNIISGINFFISTNFDFPLNFAVRGGGGLVYTLLDYKKYDNTGNPKEKGTSTTTALYYKTGVSIEYRFFSRFFLEGYADYYSINYLAMDFKSFRFSCLAGFHF
jgi:hypothetical protein